MPLKSSVRPIPGDEAPHWPLRVVDMRVPARLPAIGNFRISGVESVAVTIIDALPGSHATSQSPAEDA
jgi:hypothetical protein